MITQTPGFSQDLVFTTQAPRRLLDLISLWEFRFRSNQNTEASAEASNSFVHADNNLLMLTYQSRESLNEN